jgi:hypothetical protein
VNASLIKKIVLPIISFSRKRPQKLANVELPGLTNPPGKAALQNFGPFIA